MKKDYRELYEKITRSDWFKKAYHNKSLGECPIVVEELEESEDERIMDALLEYFGEQCDMSDVNGFYAYEIYPKEIGDILSEWYPDNNFAEICKHCKWDDDGGRITVDVIWEDNKNYL